MKATGSRSKLTEEIGDNECDFQIPRIEMVNR